MNLQELKRMISEEYRKYLSEQPNVATPGAPGMEPTIDVSDDDVDMDMGGDSEATLRQIYDMLKAYFEGGAGDAMPATPAAVPAGEEDEDMEDVEGDEEEEEEEEEEKALQERFKKLANIIKG